MDALLQDLRYAIRLLGKKPGFTIVAIISLALGIGGNTTIFSVVNGVLLRPLAYQDPDRLVRVEGSVKSGLTAANVSPSDFVDWRDQNHVFEAISAIRLGGNVMTGSGEPLRLSAGVVTPDYFSILRAKAVAGRFFTPEEGQPGKNGVVVLSEPFWRRQFAADRNIIGQTITLDGGKYEIVGVSSAALKYPVPEVTQEPDIYRPLVFPSPAGNRGGHFLRAIARLKPGVSMAQAQAEMDLISRQLEKQYPETNTDRGARVISLHESMVGSLKTGLYVLLGAVGFVLLIACVNMANLLLARASTRQKEMAVRLALGAGRARIIRQLLTESLLLALAGGAVGLLLSVWTIDVIKRLGANEITRLDEVRIDGRILAFTAAVSILTGILFGLAPALSASRSNLQISLKDGGKEPASSGRAGLRNLLVVSEVALALILLVGAGLLLKSFWRLNQVDPGFQAAQLLTFDLDLPASRYRDVKLAPVFFDQYLARLQSLPGVQAVGVTDILPLGGNYSCDSFAIEGRPAVAPGEEPCAEMRSTSAGYFRTMGIRLVRGRLFNDQDRPGAPLVALINEAMSRKFFPGEDPIGKRINLDGSNPQWREVVGIIGDVKHFGLAEKARPEFYRPEYQSPSSGMTVVARVSGDPNNLIAAARTALHAMDKDLPIYSVRTMESLVSDSMAQPRFRTMLLSVFAGLALILAVLGIYSVMAYSAIQRTHEIGIRLALGAQSGQILRLIVGQGMALTLIGALIGLSGALMLARVISSLLFGVGASDPTTFGVVLLLIGLVSFLACYLPARRASRLDPLEALKES